MTLERAYYTLRCRHYQATDTIADLSILELQVFLSQADATTRIHPQRNLFQE